MGGGLITSPSHCPVWPSFLRESFWYISLGFPQIHLGCWTEWALRQFSWIGHGKPLPYLGGSELQVEITPLSQCLGKVPREPTVWGCPPSLKMSRVLILWSLWPRNPSCFPTTFAFFVHRELLIIFATLRVYFYE